MDLDKKFQDQILKVSTRAALAAFRFVGLKDKNSADKAAVDSMRSELNKINMRGEIVIGEGELDEAPMLYIGEKLGTLNGQELDIAVDPLEGTNFAASNLPGALSVIAVAEKSNLFNAPETLFFGGTRTHEMAIRITRHMEDIIQGISKLPSI